MGLITLVHSIPMKKLSNGAIIQVEDYWVVQLSDPNEEKES